MSRPRTLPLLGARGVDAVATLEAAHQPWLLVSYPYTMRGLPEFTGRCYEIIIWQTCTGKSTAMAAIRNTLREYCVSAKQFNSSDFPVLFLENVELTERQILGGDWCRVLLLDDVGVEQTEIKEYGNIIQPFVKIVEERYNRCLPLVLSTNLNGNEFMQRYGLRTADRLREMAMTIKYEGKFYRI